MEGHWKFREGGKGSKTMGRIFSATNSTSYTFQDFKELSSEIRLLLKMVVATCAVIFCLTFSSSAVSKSKICLTFLATTFQCSTLVGDH